MNLEVSIDGERGKAAATGDLDIYAAAELKERLVALCAGVRELELDLSATGLVDTAGLQLLLAAKRLLEAKGGGLRIVAASEGCAAVLELLRVAVGAAGGER